MKTLSRVASEDRFKTTIRRVVQDEMFWRQLLDDNRWNSRVDTKLDRFETRMNSNIETQIALKLPSGVREQLSATLPGQVAKELNHQIPGYLNNNHQMTILLDAHSDRLKAELEERARKYLERFVADEKYHEVNRMYFRAFEDKGEQEISEFARAGKETIAGIKSQYRNDLMGLTKNLNRTKEQSERIEYLERANKDLRSEVSNWRWLSVLNTATIVTIIAVSFLYPSTAQIRFV